MFCNLLIAPFTYSCPYFLIPFIAMKNLLRAVLILPSSPVPHGLAEVLGVPKMSTDCAKATEEIYFSVN